MAACSSSRGSSCARPMSARSPMASVCANTRMRVTGAPAALEAATPVYPEFERFGCVLARAHARVARPGPSRRQVPAWRSLARLSAPRPSSADRSWRIRQDPAGAFDGGQQAVAASADPMIQLARASMRTRARCASNRGRRSTGPRSARSRHLRSALQGVRHQSLSRRHVHAARQLRRRRRLD